MRQPDPHLRLGKITLKSRKGPVTDRRTKEAIRVTAALMGVRSRQAYERGAVRG